MSIVPPRRDQNILERGKMTLRFIKYLEEMTGDVNLVVDDAQNVFALEGAIKRVNSLLTTIQKRTDDLEQQGVSLSPLTNKITKLFNRIDDIEQALTPINSLLNQLTKLTGRINDVEQLNSAPTKLFTGANSSTDNAIARFDGASGKTVQNSGILISDDDELVLPLKDDATSPTIQFGNGDTGFFESLDDILDLSIAGVQKFRWTASLFISGDAVTTGVPAIQTIVATATTPGFTFAFDTDTGIGRAAADELSLIAGGVEVLRLDATDLTAVGNLTLTGTGGVFSTNASGHVTSKQSLDVATAGGRFIGASNRGSMGRVDIAQTATSADGGFIKFFTATTGGALTLALTLDESQNAIFEGNVDVKGGQIKFPATQIPSADANTLDDYKENTFTAVVADAPSGGNTASIGSQDSFYTKIGNLATVHLELVNINTSGMTAGNSIFIRNLPFTSAGSTPQGQPGTLMLSQITFSGHPVALVGQSVTYFRMFESNSGSGQSVINVSDLTSGTADIIATITYRTT